MPAAGCMILTFHFASEPRQGIERHEERSLKEVINTALRAGLMGISERSPLLDRCY
jgi:hypothetical protein